uniref:Uncharacterized protein n=2 Tax=Candidatus Bipolaricaulota TaxID=67810 RepID=H5SET8_9BACT|nr:hypothetical protein HGMM_F17E10C04 [uncultured Acetothermia bacterium]BAL58340.1 hypothetical conserved protein [Candidatus Acetothermum autotrophicum]
MKTSFMRLLEDKEEITDRLVKIEMRLGRLETSLQELLEIVSERAHTKQTWVRDLHRDDLEVLSPIPITIEEFDDEVVATWPEVEVYASAETESEAIAKLKQEIVQLFEELRETPDKELGKLPRSWKRILLGTIRIKNG